MGERSRTFHADSSPYLVPTEHPWDALAALDLQGKRVLTVAGSGDLPVFLAGLGPSDLAAVDVSRKACWMCELKRAAYGTLNRREFSLLFFPGISTAAGVENPPEDAPEAQRACYRRVRPLLSDPARAFFDPIFGSAPKGSNPLARFLRPTDRLHVPLLPSLAGDEDYGRWAAGTARGFSIVCASVEEFLEKENAPFHFLYLSNILEYVRADFYMAEEEAGYRRFLESFWTVLDRALEPAGTVGVYIFQGKDTAAFQECLEDLAIPVRMGYKAKFVPVAIRPPGLGRTVWRHTLALLDKPPS